MVNVRSRISVGILLMLALSTLLLFWSALTASAQTVDGQCQVEIANLRTATADATFIGKNAEKDEAGLIGKLDSASAKLGEGKNADAIQSLNDFRDKVIMLNAQGKIDPEDAAALIAGADDAIACINGLGTSQ